MLRGGGRIVKTSRCPIKNARVASSVDSTENAHVRRAHQWRLDRWTGTGYGAHDEPTQGVTKTPPPDNWLSHYDIEIEDDTGRRPARMSEGIDGLTRLHEVLAQDLDDSAMDPQSGVTASGAW